MSLIDDTFDCCGRRFDPMGDPLLIRGPGYEVYCYSCRGPEKREQDLIREAKAEAWDEAARECHALGWLHDFALSDTIARNPYREGVDE